MRPYVYRLRSEGSDSRTSDEAACAGDEHELRVKLGHRSDVTMTIRDTSVPCKRGEHVVIGLIMAGGRGERMRDSGIDIPKPLVRVTGVPLLDGTYAPSVQLG